MKNSHFIYVLLIIILANTPLFAQDRSKGSIIIFISLSIPENSLKDILETAAKIKAPVVLRGFANNSIKETLKRIYKITNNNKTSIQIDPELFKHYEITKVPALVIDNGFDYLVYFGNIAIVNTLELVTRNEANFSSIASFALSNLQER